MWVKKKLTSKVYNVSVTSPVIQVHYTQINVQNTDRHIVNGFALKNIHYCENSSLDGEFNCTLVQQYYCKIL